MVEEDEGDEEGECRVQQDEETSELSELNQVSEEHNVEREQQDERSGSSERTSVCTRAVDTRGAIMVVGEAALIEIAMQSACYKILSELTSVKVALCAEFSDLDWREDGEVDPVILELASNHDEIGRAHV